MDTKQKGFTLSELARVIFITTILGLVVVSFDSKADGEFTLFGEPGVFSIAAGTDLYKAVGYDYGEFRYREKLHTFEDSYWTTFGFSLYGGGMFTLGADFYITRNKWMYAFGIEGAKRNEEVVDSVGGYELLVEYAMTEHWAISFKHRSNCRQICREVPGLDLLPKGGEDKTNGGFNWLMIRYSW